MESITLISDPDTFENEFDSYVVASSSSSNGFRTMATVFSNIPVGVMGMPVNNSTLTYLRLGIDGNIRLHTYFLGVPLMTSFSVNGLRSVENWGYVKNVWLALWKMDYLVGATIALPSLWHQ